MNHRINLMTALAVITCASLPCWAATESTQDGKFVKVTDRMLTMTNKDGTEHSHTLALEVKVIRDGLDCAVKDLKAGMKIRVTTDNSDNKVIRVEALDQHTLFANTHDGKFASLVNNQLTITEFNEKKHTFTVAADTTMTCDGQKSTSEKLKIGMRMRLTTKPDNTDAVTHIEAIDKNADFSSLVNLALQFD